MPVPADKAALERDLLRDRAYTTLRDAIVDGTLAPGERLVDAELCAFDMLELDGKDLRCTRIEERKRTLAKLLGAFSTVLS